MPHPYKSMPEEAFWRAAVAKAGVFGLKNLYRAKFPISPQDRISTAGSCFAQHIGRCLRASGFNYQDFEPAPAFLPEDRHAAYGFGIYSARYGNLYTARQYLQLYQRAFGLFSPQEEYWEQDGRFYDPFRPAIEPSGFESLEELRAVRASHLAAARRMFRTTDLFVFTFGLTEAWLAKGDGAVFPTCPGKVAGTFDPGQHVFHNFTYPEIIEDMARLIGLVRNANAKARFLFTVSPVPLAATAGGAHVLAATTYSKSVLRAVAGDLAAGDGRIDYFPSYELVTSAVARGMFYEPDMRNVASQGVDYVMAHFFAEHRPPARTEPLRKREADQDEIVCEEQLLDQAAE